MKLSSERAQRCSRLWPWGLDRGPSHCVPVSPAADAQGLLNLLICAAGQSTFLRPQTLLERRVLVPGARVSVGQYRYAQDGYSLFSLRALEKYPESWCWLLTQDEGTALGQQSSEAEHAGAGVPSWFSSTGSGY